MTFYVTCHIIPVSFIYVSLGSGLNFIHSQKDLSLMEMLKNPNILLFLMLLAILALIPIFIKKFSRTQKLT